MKSFLRPALPLVALPTLAFAIYAPIPEQEQGKPLTYKLGASVYHDSNIFGGATGEISSLVYRFTAAVAYNGSIDDQTFASASYEISNDHIVDRPGAQNLTSHVLNARLAHSFSPDSNIDLTAGYNIAKNPASLLAGIPLNTDQSFKRGQLDARYTTAVGEKTGLVTKYRFINFAYDNAGLGADLDRSEHLLGLEGSYALLSETKLVAEYRHQAIGYDTGGNTKDKDSNFLMAGVDYSPSKELLLSGRAGFEARQREAAPDSTAPYVELSSRYTYNEGSFLAAGYTYTIEEPSDVANYTDTKVNRFFVNLQHRLSGTITASGSLTYEPSQLQGRPAVHADADEKTTRLGLGLSWQPTKNWSVSGTCDLDDVNSDDVNRGQNRSRYGVSARYTF
jgi:predicted porin